MDSNDPKHSQIVENLKIAYSMELETVLNYIANGINLDGIRAREVAESLRGDVKDEVKHAQLLGERLKILNELVPGSKSLRFNQDTLQPHDDNCDVAAVIRGVIDAEDAACRQYQKLIEICDGADYVTQDLCIKLLADEEEHRREFQGYLKEYEREPEWAVRHA